ncbi:MAG: acyl-ACP--UDP-N-acetylglucosamine O-acyltransferase [Lactobacillus sp.]|jgi:UDP-N-acetylglucosamine acyltransferase|nr:acyl-ACP--UDP-N-acetylglucosamine O-acyltransferase [Lactobacillus sp.]
MTNIHPTAVIEDGAQIAASAKIGPFCVVSSKAKIADNVELIAHVTVMNDTTIGEGTKVFPGAVLGAGPQDHGNEFNDGMKLIIGKDNIIRENVTMQCGTPKEQMITRVGNHGMFMVNSHVAHDCVVGDNVIMTNNAVIGGHVHVGDGAILGGNCAVHQFVRIGRKAMIGGLSGVARDVIPFGLVMGDRGWLRGLNLIGLKRSGLEKSEVAAVMGAYKLVFQGKEGTFEDRLAEAKTKFAANPMVMEQINFIYDALEGKRKVLIADPE